MIPILFKSHFSLISTRSQVHISALAAGRVEDQQNNRDDYHCQAAEYHEFLIGILLVLVCLGKVLVGIFKVQVGFLHFLQTQLYFFTLSIDHDTGLGCDIFDLIDQPLYFLKLRFLLFEDPFPDCVLICM